MILFKDFVATLIRLTPETVKYWHQLNFTDAYEGFIYCYQFYSEKEKADMHEKFKITVAK